MDAVPALAFLHGVMHGRAGPRDTLSTPRSPRPQPVQHHAALPDTKLRRTLPWYKCNLYFQSMPGKTPFHLSWEWAADPTAQSCSTTRAPPAPSPRDVPPARAGRTLLLPYPSLWGHGTVTRGAPWDTGDAQLQPCLPRALPQLLHCLTCSGLTGSARAPRLPRLSPKLASLPCTAEHPGAQTQHYLSRMRKSSTIRTMGRKMRSRLNSSATSSRASSRR